jgi:excisionase family DNA binding protein
MTTIYETLLGEPGLINAARVATLLGFHIKYVYELARKNSLPCYRIHGAVKFDGREVAAWLKGKRSC